jgi:hypothetical protein
VTDERWPRAKELFQAVWRECSGVPPYRTLHSNPRFAAILREME